MENKKPSKLEKTAYFAKYTAGSYLDALSCVPIWAAEKIAQGSEKVLGDKNPKFLSVDYTHENSQIYKGRERLRDSLDTRPGALFLQSNIIGVIPFITAGMPAAELAQSGIEEYLSDASELTKCVLNSLCTLGAQMAAGYGTFMANEIRVNKQKYVNENGRLSISKIGKGTLNTAKAFLKFDLSYTAGKTAGQTFMLYQGQDPWKASGIFDSLVIPLWYAISIPLGLNNGVIETKQTQEWKGNEVTEFTQTLKSKNK